MCLDGSNDETLLHYVVNYVCIYVTECECVEGVRGFFAVGQFTVRKKISVWLKGGSRARKKSLFVNQSSPNVNIRWNTAKKNEFLFLAYFLVWMYRKRVGQKNSNSGKMFNLYLLRQFWSSTAAVFCTFPDLCLYKTNRQYFRISI